MGHISRLNISLQGGASSFEQYLLDLGHGEELSICLAHHGFVFLQILGLVLCSSLEIGLTRYRVRRSRFLGVIFCWHFLLVVEVGIC